MRVVDIALLWEFSEQHADARKPLEAWLAEAVEATWEGPADIKARYATASILSNNRVVFNIKGKHYRLLVQISFKLKIVTVLRVGTHAEYNRWKL
jgi:mRNA interferase HigB